MTNPSDLSDLDFTSFKPLPPVSAAQERALGPAVEVGTSQLKATGFFVTMPREPGSAPPAPEMPLVLIIDDDDSVCQVLEMYLRDGGYATRSARNREEVMRVLRLPPKPDLILCDVEMPDLNGFELLDKFHQSAVFGAVPVVMLTGRSAREDIVRGLSLGAAGYITKPARLGVVEEALRKLLR